MDKIILLDSNSLIHRAYYALQNSALTNSAGQPTGAVFGFFSMLSKLIAEEKPTHIAAAFDLRAPTFRHKMYDGYKATRKPMPEDLASQLPLLKGLIFDFGIKILELEGYEADDILGTIARRFDVPTLIVTGDRDSLQLIDDSTNIIYTKRGITDVVRYDRARLLEEGLTPEGVIDYKALRGDASDNIPGIPGIGEKTAMELLSEYKTLDGVLDNAANVKGKLGEKIAAGKDIARLSYKLATIDTNVPIPCTLQDIAFTYPLKKTAKEGLLRLEFNTMLRRFEFDDNDETDVSFAKTEVKTVDVDTLDGLKDAVKIVKGKPLAIMMTDAVCFAAEPEVQYRVKESGDLFGGLSFDEIIAELKPLIEADTAKTVYDLKTLMHKLNGYGVTVGGEITDVLLAAHLVRGGRNFSSLSQVFTSFGFGEEENVCTLLPLKNRLTADLVAKGMANLYKDVELPLEYVLFDMENAGIKVNKSVLFELGEKYTDELEGLVSAIYNYAGENFNINSPKQLGVILFDKLGLHSKKKNKTGLSVGIEVLTDLYEEHPIIPPIIRYRQLSKLQSTYVEGLKKVIAADGRIHTEFKQTVTSTGRLSSTEPNLQNIPTRTAEGREIRKAFVAAEGNVLVCADYSQIELRLLAHFSGDENLIRAYRESRDIHASTAADIFGVPQSEVTSEMRRNAKAVNFGIIYGISDFGLANNLSIGPRQAKKYIDKYFETYPKVKEYMAKNVDFALQNGYVSTYLGRVRELTELKSPNHAVREFGKRAAMNLPLQGTAADIVKLAMLKVHERLKSTGAKMLLQVHDELIVEAPLNEEKTVTDILTDCMENAVTLSVPLTVNVKSGVDWFVAD